MKTLQLFPSSLAGSIAAPPSKSMAHRLLIAAALAGGGQEASLVRGLDYSADIAATLQALRVLGADIACEGSTAHVVGVLRQGFYPAPTVVDCNESGSTLRLLVPLFSLSGKEVHFGGAARLYARPQSVYQSIFAEQKLIFEVSPTGLRLQGALRPGDYHVPGDVSSQFISGLLFALPLLPGDSRLLVAPPLESRSYIELTREAQRLFGVHSHWQDDYTLLIPGGQQYTPGSHIVEGDWSQAAVPAVLAACACPDIRLQNLSPTSPQGDRAVLGILQRCGAVAQWQGDTLHLSSPAGLTSPDEIDLADCPDLGPMLCTLALFCKGTTRIVNAGRLRIKESDRIAAIETELRKLGADISSTQDSITINGGKPLAPGAVFSSHNDHRIVMACAAAALIAGLPATIENADAVSKSWPSFFDDIAALGAKWKEK